MILIGLTGTIGSGKTFALNFFKSEKINGKRNTRLGRTFIETKL